MAKDPAGSSLTELLQRYGSGERDMADGLFREIWPTLRQLALRQLNRERFAAPVSPTELINELWLRNLNRGGWNITSRDHFYAIVSVAIRRVLVDLARQRLAASRGFGEVPVPLDEDLASATPSNDDLEEIVSIGILIERLEKKDRLGALIFDMYYFAGYTFEEIAETTGLTVRQVAYRWTKSERWIKTRLLPKSNSRVKTP